MHEFFRTPDRMRPIAALAAVLAAAALAACDRPNTPPTAGQMPDSTVARGEQRPKQAQESAKSTPNETAQSTERADRRDVRQGQGRCDHHRGERQDRG